MSQEYEDDFYSEENLSKIEDIQLNTDETVVSTEVKVGADNDTEGDVNEKSDAGSNEDEYVDEDSAAKSYKFNIGQLGVESLEVEDDGNDSMFSPDERLKQFSDSIIACCFGEREISRYAVDKVLSLSAPNIFRDENYILFSVLYQFRGKIRHIHLDEEFIRLFLNRNKQILQKAKGYIDISAYGEVDGSVELGYIGGVLKHYRRLLTLPDLDELEFNTVFEKYLIEYKSIEAKKTYDNAQIILSDGLKIGRKNYSGFNDSFNYTRRKLAELEGIDCADSGSGFVTARELLLEEKEANTSYKVSDFDKLEALNKIYGGIYTGTFYQVIAPPKAGKTKFCTRLVHTTAVKYGNNVTVWAAEGGSDNFLAELRAIHFDYIYNTGVSVTEKKFGIDQDVISHGKYPSEELKQLELSSKLDLASNRDYGEIDFINRTFNVETFIEDIDTSVKSNNSKVVVLDYLQLIGSERNLSERERVAEAYKQALKYCRANNIALITPGQYKQDAFEQLVAKGSTADAEMRTSAGVSSEVLRTPDIIFAFWATTQDLLNNSMKILSMPCRFNKAFPEIPVMIDLGVSQFISV